VHPIIEVYLTGLGPNKAEVLRVVSCLLRQNYLAVVRALEDGPVLLCGGSSFEVMPLYRWLQERRAGVRLQSQATE